MENEKRRRACEEAAARKLAARAMTEYEKLITAEQIAHTVEITECLTGKTGMANTCAGRVALFYGAEDGNDDKIVTPRTFSRQFKITAAILG